jgi:hypothetical protein
VVLIFPFDVLGRLVYGIHRLGRVSLLRIFERDWIQYLEVQELEVQESAEATSVNNG